MKHIALLPGLALALAACSEAPLPSGPESSQELPLMFSNASSLGYTGIDLGTLGGSYSSAWRVNMNGQVIGQSTTAAGESHGFLWEAGLMVDLGTLGGSVTRVSALNDAGHVTGCSVTADGESHPFIWINGVMTDLAPEYDHVIKCFTDINNQGQVLISWLPVVEEDGVSRNHAFVWANGGLTDLVEQYGSPVASHGIEMNDAGDIVGRSFVILSGNLHLLPSGFQGRRINDNGQAIGTSGSRTPRGFFWSGGYAVEIDALPCSVAPCIPVSVEPEDMDNSGTVVGGSTGQAFQWQAGITIPLGTLGGRSSVAHAIDEAARVVGAANTADGEWHAVLWDAGAAYDLGTVGRETSEAYDITGSFIVGESGLNFVADTRATLWRRITPVDLVARLIAMVEALQADGTLNRGQAHSLINKLNIAMAMLNDGKTGPAINKIDSFVHEVRAMMSGNSTVLTNEQGQPLVDGALEAIAAVGS